MRYVGPDVVLGELENKAARKPAREGGRGASLPLATPPTAFLCEWFPDRGVPSDNHRFFAVLVW